METMGEPLKLVEYERILVGLIAGKVDWRRLTAGYIDRTRRLYEGNIKLIITGIGDEE